MKTTLRVRTDVEGEYEGEGGKMVKTRKLDLVDLSPTPFVAALSYSMRKDEWAKYPVGSLAGKEVEFGVADIVSYDNRPVRALKGVILQVLK
jgi:hypothetical protein